MQNHSQYDDSTTPHFNNRYHPQPKDHYTATNADNIRQQQVSFSAGRRTNSSHSSINKSQYEQRSNVNFNNNFMNTTTNNGKSKFPPPSNYLSPSSRSPQTKYPYSNSSNLLSPIPLTNKGNSTTMDYLSSPSRLPFNKFSSPSHLLSSPSIIPSSPSHLSPTKNSVQYFNDRSPNPQTDSQNNYQLQRVISQLRIALHQSLQSQQQTHQKLHQQRNRNYQTLQLKRRLQQQLTKMQFQLDKINSCDNLQQRQSRIKAQTAQNQNIRLASQVNDLHQELKKVKKQHRDLMSENNKVLAENTLLEKENQALVQKVDQLSQEIGVVRNQLQKVRIEMEGKLKMKEKECQQIKQQRRRINIVQYQQQQQRHQENASNNNIKSNKKVQFVRNNYHHQPRNNPQSQGSIMINQLHNSRSTSSNNVGGSVDNSLSHSRSYKSPNSYAQNQNQNSINNQQNSNVRSPSPSPSPSSSLSVVQQFQPSLCFSQKQINSQLDDYNKLLSQNRSMKKLYREMYQQSYQQQQKEQLNNKPMENQKYSGLAAIITQRSSQFQHDRNENEQEQENMLKTFQKNKLAEEIDLLREQIVTQTLLKLYVKAITQAQKQHTTVSREVSPSQLQGQNCLVVFIKLVSKNIQRIGQMVVNYLLARDILKQELKVKKLPQSQPETEKQVELEEMLFKVKGKLKQEINATTLKNSNTSPNKKKTITMDNNSELVTMHMNVYFLGLFRLLTLIEKNKKYFPDNGRRSQTIAKLQHYCLKYVHKICEELSLLNNSSA